MSDLIERLQGERTRIWNNDGELKLARSLLLEAADELTRTRAALKEALNKWEEHLNFRQANAASNSIVANAQMPRIAALRKEFGLE